MHSINQCISCSKRHEILEWFTLLSLILTLIVRSILMKVLQYQNGCEVLKWGKR